MRCLRRMWDSVRELQIKSVQVRETFKHIDTIKNGILKGRFIFILKIIRMPCKCILARLIYTVQTNKRRLGRPNITVRYYFINDI